MTQALLGTAGHIDHGKSALIKALTGIDPDRLPEEKKRGITIDLGFAHLALPSGTLGIIDVPGHEKFIRHMVAGAQGIDIVLLVVAANEGVRPQTREHLQICRLLGISRGCVALTKKDLVDAETLTLAEEEIRETLRGTFLGGAPAIEVSSLTGEGIDGLKAALDSLLGSIPPRTSEGPFRLPIDRVFSVKGFGTVVTGSVISGRIAVEDEVEILPSGRKARVRGLQSYHQEVREVSVGRRAAVNLQGVEKAEVERGEVIVSPGYLGPITKFYASFTLLGDAKKPVKDGMEASLLVGTSAVRARLRPVGGDIIAPGEEGFASVVPEIPVSGLHGDRFIIRAFAWNQTIGGGILLEPAPRRERRPLQEIVEHLTILKTGGPADKVMSILRGASLNGATPRELSVGTRLFGPSLHQAIREAEDKGSVLSIGENGYIHKAALGSARAGLISALEGYHARYPLKEGLHKEELRAAISSHMSEKVFAYLLREMSGSGAIVLQGDYVRLAAHTVTLTGKDRDLKDLLLDIFHQKGLSSPSPEEVAASMKEDRKKIDELISVLTREGHLVKVKGGLYFHKDAVQDLESRLTDFLKEKKEITTQEFKELTGVTRKFAIPLAEYFDGKKITLRVGDKRVLRKAPVSIKIPLPEREREG